MATDPSTRKRFHSFIIGGAKPTLSESTKLFPKLLQNGVDEFVNSLKEMFPGNAFPSGVEERFRKNDQKAWIAANSNPGDWPDYTDMLSDIDVPCCFFTGSEDPDCAALEQASRLVKDSMFVKLDGQTHTEVYWQSKEPKTVEIIIDFLSKHFSKP